MQRAENTQNTFKKEQKIWRLKLSDFKIYSIKLL